MGTRKQMGRASAMQVKALWAKARNCGETLLFAHLALKSRKKGRKSNFFPFFSKNTG
jgi:hypothetical protein